MDKLNDIKVSTSQVSEFAQKAVLKGDWHPLDTALSVPTFYVNIGTSLIVSKGNWKYAVKRSSIHFVCDTSQDAGTLLMAFAYLNGYPDAQKMLWYYLTGNGKELEVDTERVFREDGTLRKFVVDKILSEIKGRKKTGKFNVTQDKYGNQNWRNAFGSININWTVMSSKIEIWIENTYDWHPGESRISQCVHQAMARAKEYGAVPFHYHGTKLNIEFKK